MKLLPGYYNLGQPRKPTPNPDLYLSNGYSTEVKARYQSEAATTPQAARPFALALGQVLYHSGKLSTHAPGLITIAPNTGRLHMNAKDMERLGVTDGAKVRVTTAQGKLDVGVQADLTMLPGSCFFPEHFNEPPVKDLMAVEIDRHTGVPYFKLTSAAIQKI